MSGLRVATFCAEPTSPSVQAFGMAHVTPDYINSYWATEHGGIAWTQPYGNADFPLKPDTHAWPLPWIVGDVWVEDCGRGASHDAPFARDGERRRAVAARRGRRERRDRHRRALSVSGAHDLGRCGQFPRADGRVAGGWRGDAARAGQTATGGAGAARGPIRRAISRSGTKTARSASRPQRRCDQRLGPPHGHRGDRGRDPARQGARSGLAGRQCAGGRRAAPREGADPARLRRARRGAQAQPRRPHAG